MKHRNNKTIEDLKNEIAQIRDSWRKFQNHKKNYDFLNNLLIPKLEDFLDFQKNTIYQQLLEYPDNYHEINNGELSKQFLRERKIKIKNIHNELLQFIKSNKLINSVMNLSHEIIGYLATIFKYRIQNTETENKIINRIDTFLKNANELKNKTVKTMENFRNTDGGVFCDYSEIEYLALIEKYERKIEQLNQIKQWTTTNLCDNKKVIKSSLAQFQQEDYVKDKEEERNQNLSHNEFENDEEGEYFDCEIEYLKQTDKDFILPTQTSFNLSHIVRDFHNFKYAECVRIEHVHKCEVCNQDMILHENNGLFVCPICGLTDDNVSDNGTSTEKQIMQYKRVNHFMEWLDCFQAKELIYLPNEQKERIIKKLGERPGYTAKNASVEEILRALKELKLNKFYDHIVYIHNVITGKPVPFFTSEQERFIKFQFEKIEKACVDIAKTKQSSIKYLQYSFTMKKILEIMKTKKIINTLYSEYFPSSISDEKKAEQEELWKQIKNILKF